jgi:hypothetical protein
MKKSRKQPRSAQARPRGGRRSGAIPDELLPEYDPDLIRRGVRGKYAADYTDGTNIVVLDPDVAKRFPNAASVNDALRALGRIIDGQARAKQKSSRRTA